MRVSSLNLTRATVTLSEIGDRLPNVDQVERTRKMTSVSFHNLLNQLGEANWLLCENNSDPDLASLSTYPQRTDMVVPVGKCIIQFVIQYDHINVVQSHKVK